jgi:hypothetical protein
VILDVCRPDTLYLLEEGFEVPGLFFKGRRVPLADVLGTSLTSHQSKCSTELCRDRRWGNINEIYGRIGTKSMSYRCCRKQSTCCGMIYLKICR